MLFLIVSATFLLLVSSSLTYSLLIRGTLERQTTQIALSGLISALELAYPPADALVKSDPDNENAFGSFCAAQDKDSTEPQSCPFLMESDSLIVTGKSAIPSNLADLISRKLRSGAFVAQPIGDIPDPARLCALDMSGESGLQRWFRCTDRINCLASRRILPPTSQRREKSSRCLWDSFALAYVFFLVLLILVLKIITEPLKTLTRTADHFAGGDFNTKVKVPKTVSEIRVLAEAFNHMGTELKIQRDSLKRILTIWKKRTRPADSLSTA